MKEKLQLFKDILKQHLHMLTYERPL